MLAPFFSQVDNRFISAVDRLKPRLTKQHTHQNVDTFGIPR